MARVLMPLPDRDFDVTETAVPWRLLTRAGREVVFATESGAGAPRCDPLLLTGVLFGKLGAEPEAKAFYREVESSEELSRPIAWSAIEPSAFDALILPGGHAPGMRQYLGSDELQGKVAEMFDLGRPVAAICHGVLVAARATSKKTACSRSEGPRACRSTWSGARTFSPSGSSAAITERTTNTSKTR
jgi:putative intracellular protease/amidase